MCTLSSKLSIIKLFEYCNHKVLSNYYYSPTAKLLNNLHFMLVYK